MLLLFEPSTPFRQESSGLHDGVPVETLTGVNDSSPDPITLMYQSGYLTIIGYNPEFQTYRLDYPNEEVKRGFLNSLSKLYAPA